MREHPILFSTPMIRAILENWKTQTRRVIKPQPYKGEHDFSALPECPYGQSGDHIWIRETWAQDMDGEVFYAADHLSKPSTIEKWRPSIFMPRRICRITVEILDIRVQRVQDISEEDAEAEGTTPSIVGSDLAHLKYRAGFQTLWDSINAKRGYGWEMNPWIWAITFSRLISGMYIWR